MNATKDDDEAVRVRPFTPLRRRRRCRRVEYNTPFSFKPQAQTAAREEGEGKEEDGILLAEARHIRYRHVPIEMRYHC